VGLSYGVYGDALANTSNSGIGVYGTGNGFGLYGNNDSTAPATAGVWGESRLSGAVYGVGGLVNSTTPGAAAVFGTANGGSGATFGVRGQNSSNGTDAAGVRGDANAATGLTAGGYFRSASANGTGVLGWAPAAAGATYGVRGESDSVDGIGVLGYTPAASSPSNRTIGVQGQSDTASNGIGVAGFATNNAGFTFTPPLGTPIGVLGSVSNGGYGVYSIGDARVNGNLISGDIYGGVAHVDSVHLEGGYSNNSLPQCGPNAWDNGGKMILTYPIAGNDQRLYVCIERANGTYYWRQVF
jgi:hypothetical protein